MPIILNVSTKYRMHAVLWGIVYFTCTVYFTLLHNYEYILGDSGYWIINAKNLRPVTLKMLYQLTATDYKGNAGDLVGYLTLLNTFNLIWD